MNEEKEENKIFEETSTTNKIGIFTDFNNYIMYKVSPSSSSSENKELELEDKAIRTLDHHINNLFTEKTKNKHYYFNYKNKKAMDPENFRIFREKNLKELHYKIKEIKIFKNLMSKYDIRSKLDKIYSFMTDKKILIK